MYDQMKALVRNFIWGDRAGKTQAKVKWDVITLLVCKCDLGVINPRAQVKAMLAKLVVLRPFSWLGTLEGFCLKGGLPCCNHKVEVASPCLQALTSYLLLTTFKR